MISVAFPQSKADYYIITNPVDYNIANQYQQAMSASDKLDKLAGAPLRVENPDLLSGDQISRVAKCFYHGDNYFLLKNDDGKFVGEKKSERLVFRNCAIVEDTVVIINSGSLKIISLAGQVRIPGRGEKITRFFKSGTRYYVGAFDEKPFFGWCSMEPETDWRKTEKTAIAKERPSDTSLPELYRQRIAEKIASANNAYKACFDHFNARTNDQKSVPSWRCENSGEGIRCELSEQWKTGDRLSESTDALVQELENILLGSDYGVKYEDGVMEIRKRK